MRTSRRRRTPSSWFFAQMRKAAAGSLPSTSVPEKEPGVPPSQVALAEKLKADPNDDPQHRAEVLRGDWD